MAIVASESRLARRFVIGKHATLTAVGPSKVHNECSIMKDAKAMICMSKTKIKRKSSLTTLLGGTAPT